MRKTLSQSGYRAFKKQVTCSYFSREIIYLLFIAAIIVRCQNKFRGEKKHTFFLHYNILRTRIQKNAAVVTRICTQIMSFDLNINNSRKK